MKHFKFTAKVTKDGHSYTIHNELTTEEAKEQIHITAIPTIGIYANFKSESDHISYEGIVTAKSKPLAKIELENYLTKQQK